MKDRVSIGRIGLLGILLSMLIAAAFLDCRTQATFKKAMASGLAREQRIESLIQEVSDTGTQGDKKWEKSKDLKGSGGRTWAKITDKLGPDWRTELGRMEYRGGIRFELGTAELQRRELWRWPAFIRAIESCEALDGVEVLEVSLQRKSSGAVSEFQNATFEVLIMNEAHNQEDGG